MPRWLPLSILLAALVLSGCGHDPAAEQAHRAGVEALREGRHRAAVEALTTAVAARPDHVEAWFALGRAHAALGRADDAIAAYRRAIALDPRHAMAWNNLANVEFRRGAWPAAAAAYAQALEVDPDYLLALYHHGWVLRQLDRRDEAEAAFRHCAELPADGAREQRTRLDCLFYLGTLRYRADDWDSAARMMEQVLTAFPGHAEARYYLGMAYRRIGRETDARQQLAMHEELLGARRGAPITREGAP